MTTPDNKFPSPKLSASEEVFLISSADVTATAPVDNTAGDSEAPSYKVVIKRNDQVYKTLLALNTIICVLSVVGIAAMFGLAMWGMLTVTELANVVEVMRAQND